MNGEVITVSGGKYSYTLPADATSVNIVVTTTQTAVVYEGKDNFSKNFNDTKISNTAGQLYDNKDNGGTFLAPAVFDANFYAPQINSIPDNVRFGFRIFLKKAQGGVESSVADVVIGKTSGNWYLDIGYDLRGTQRNNYRLSNEQIQSVAEGTFKVIVVKNGAEHRLYAQNGDHFEYVASYTDDDATMVSFNTIDLLVHNPEGKGVGEYGVHDMTVYGEYDATMSDSELLAFLVDGKIGYREYAGKGDIQKNFSDIQSETDQRQGPLYSCGDHNNSLSRVTVTSASLYLEDPSGITENGTRFGLRIYNRIGNATNNNLVADIVIARQGNGWRLDIGYGIAINSNQPSTAYTLSDAQLTALENGSLQIFIVQRGSTYTLYALDGETLEKVEAYTDTKNGTSVSAIDFVVNTNATALERSGDRDCAVKGTTVYGNFDETLSDKELVELFAGSNAE